ncbi:MAG: mRNA surveillance protein pelota [Methanobacteriota archaeon]
MGLQVVFKDLRHGEVGVIPENPDDLWHLYNIIDKGDLVRMVTFRTIEGQQDDMKRAKKSEKKRMKLGVVVEEVGFHEFSDRLRIRGVIREGPQDLGSYHTFDVTVDAMEKLSIVKERWKSFQLDRLDEAVRQRTQPVVVFVSLDEDEATVAVLRQSGVQWVTDIDSRRSGKMYETKVESGYDYYGEVVAVVKSTKKGETPLVVVGPGFAREHLVKYGREKAPDVFHEVLVYPTGHAGMNGVHEAIKVGAAERILKDNRMSFETKLVEQVFEEIKKDGPVVYGTKEVSDAITRGAVEHLLILDVLVRSKEGEQLLYRARETKSKFTIINGLHEAGKKFEGIGGVAAFLRFKY